MLKLCAIGNNLTQLGSLPAHHHTNIPGVVFVLFTYVVFPDDISPQHFGRCTLSHRNDYLVFSSMPACLFRLLFARCATTMRRTWSFDRSDDDDVVFIQGIQ